MHVSKYILRKILHSTLQLYLQRDTIGNNDEKIGINFSFVLGGVRGRGQAYAHPPLPLSATFVAQENRDSFCLLFSYEGKGYKACVRPSTTTPPLVTYRDITEKSAFKMKKC